MQKITIMGRLVRDGVIRESQTGKKFGSFSVAVNSKVRGVEKTNYYDVLWNNYYEKTIQYLKKGTAVIVLGDLDASTEVSTKDGKTYLRLNVFADSVQFASLGTSGNTQNQTQTTAAPTTYTTGAPVMENVAPQPSYMQSAPAPTMVAPAPAPSAMPTMRMPEPTPSYATYSQPSADDDLPF